MNKCRPAVKEDVVDALGQASARLRTRLGESLPLRKEIQTRPLELATHRLVGCA